MMWDIKNKKIVKCGKYIDILLPEHPKSNLGGYIGLHRIIMENKLNRLLSYNEIVHHINKNTFDNNENNLQLIDRGKHTRIHNFKRGRSKAIIKCPNCEKIFERDKRDVAPYNKNKATFCSRHCASIFYFKKNINYKKLINENIVKVYKKYGSVA